jgi:hypothetical protein
MCYWQCGSDDVACGFSAAIAALVCRRRSGQVPEVACSILDPGSALRAVWLGQSDVAGKVLRALVAAALLLLLLPDECWHVRHPS